MLEVRDLEASYGPIRALRGVSLDINEGETIGVVGPNGAGKSTLLLAIAGVLAPVAGTITFQSTPIAGKRPDVIVGAGVSLVPEARHIFSSLTVEENLRLGATIRNDRAGVERDVARLLTTFPALVPHYHRSAGMLSGGEQQMLAIARALIARPRLLMLDEPSLGLAPIVVEAVFDVLEDLARDGVTMLLVEQNAARTLALADRVFALRGGRVHMSGEASRLAASNEFETLYLGNR